MIGRRLHSTFASAAALAILCGPARGADNLDALALEAIAIGEAFGIAQLCDRYVPSDAARRQFSAIAGTWRAVIADRAFAAAQDRIALEMTMRAPLQALRGASVSPCIVADDLIQAAPAIADMLREREPM